MPTFIYFCSEIISVDPKEEKNIFSRESPELNGLLNLILKEMKRAVPEDKPPSSVLGDPRNYGGIYTPGWC